MFVCMCVCEYYSCLSTGFFFLISVICYSCSSSQRWLSFLLRLIKNNITHRTARAYPPNTVRRKYEEQIVTTAVHGRRLKKYACAEVVQSNEPIFLRRNVLLLRFLAWLSRKFRCALDSSCPLIICERTEPTNQNNFHFVIKFSVWLDNTILIFSWEGI